MGLASSGIGRGTRELPAPLGVEVWSLAWMRAHGLCPGLAEHYCLFSEILTPDVADSAAAGHLAGRPGIALKLPSFSPGDTRYGPDGLPFGFGAALHFSGLGRP
jgi:hypothetical protein